jgi:hypothetical protein
LVVEVKNNIAPGGFLKTQDGAPKGGLPRAALAHQAKGFTLADVQGNAGDGLQVCLGPAQNSGLADRKRDLKVTD